jgi:TetR/AcrR family transcriptional regulator, transcriptional repressor of bet genes
MPRQVDHVTRRAELAAAVWSLVARGGLEVVSLRSVAAEAGVSMGRVQHYFPTKDDLLLDALRHAHRRMEVRVEARLDPTATPRDWLASILDELLAEHPETRDAIRVHSAFEARALSDPRVEEVLRDGDDEIIGLCVQVVAAAGVSDDPHHDGYALFALAGGLGGDVALRGADITRARTTLHRWLDRLAPAR